jgi:hypothetical protein
MKDLAALKGCQIFFLIVFNQLAIKFKQKESGF